MRLVKSRSRSELGLFGPAADSPSGGETQHAVSGHELRGAGQPLSRRRFVGTLAGAGLAVAARPWRALGASEGPLPTRVLGRTGARVTILGLGTAPIGEGPVETPEAVRIFGEVMNYADRNIYDFERTVLPECRKRSVGVVAMKVYAGIVGGFPNHRNGFVGCNTPVDRLPQALAYALDLEGVSSAVIGPYTLEQALHNVELARNYRPLTDTERAGLLAYGEELARKLGSRYGPIA